MAERYRQLQPQDPGSGNRAVWHLPCICELSGRVRLRCKRQWLRRILRISTTLPARIRR